MTRSGGAMGVSVTPTNANGTSSQRPQQKSGSPSPSAFFPPSAAAVTPVTATLSSSVVLPRSSNSGGGKTGRQSSKFGTVNYSVDEMRRLNEKVRAVMPLVGEDWLHVAYQFNYMRPESIPYREVESLKRKFKKMYCSRTGAGGKLPDYIEEAKELRRMINQRSEKAQIESSDTHSELDTQDLNDPKRDEPITGMALRARAGSGSSGSLSTTLAEVDGARKDGEKVDAMVGTSGHSEMALDDSQPLASVMDEQHRKALLSENHQQQPEPNVENLQTDDVNDSDGDVDAARDISAKLRQMEEEYHRTIEAKRTTREMAAVNMEGLNPAPTLSTSSFAGNGTNMATTTSGIINMLKHSIERKRRTIEEQMLSESERVRKERKKRKMEQVLYSIHQEQRERELGGAAASDGPVGGAVAYSGLPPPSPSRQSIHSSPRGMARSSRLPPAVSSQEFMGMLPTAPLLPASTMPGLASDPSLAMMELMLQYMTAQQQEYTRQWELEQERRAREHEERERQRRDKERQRRQERRELMLVMAALLGDKFPDSLKHHLEASIDDKDRIEVSGDAVVVPDGRNVESTEEFGEAHGNEGKDSRKPGADQYDDEEDGTREPHGAVVDDTALI